MKKLSLICMSLLLILAVTSCGKTFIDEGPDTLNPVKGVDWGITLKAENVTTASATLVISHSGKNHSGELSYGSEFSLQVWRDNAWEKVPYIVDEGIITWTMEAYLLPVGGVNNHELKWDYIYGELPKGRYLLTKEFQNFLDIGNVEKATFSAEFEIK